LNYCGAFFFNLWIYIAGFLCIVLRRPYAEQCWNFWRFLFVGYRTPASDVRNKNG
jgi:hypothetical protein